MNRPIITSDGKPSPWIYGEEPECDDCEGRCICAEFCAECSKHESMCRCQGEAERADEQHPERKAA